MAAAYLNNTAGQTSQYPRVRGHPGINGHPGIKGHAGIYSHPCINGYTHAICDDDVEDGDHFYNNTKVTAKTIYTAL